MYGYDAHAEMDRAHEQERYEEWCEEQGLDFVEGDHWEEYANYVVERREAWAEEQMERGGWGLAYIN
jgi:hypothetical protein